MPKPDTAFINGVKMMGITDAELDAWEKDIAAHPVTGLHHQDELRLIAEVRRLRAMMPPSICLVCGADEPCMTEADLKPGDPGVPCTFDPTPRELWEKFCELRAELHKAQATLKALGYELWSAAVWKAGHK